MAGAEQPYVTVEQLLRDDELAELELSVLAGGEQLDNRVLHPRVQKPGLSFAGYYPYIKAGRVQIVGESEIAYLETVDEEERRRRFEHITSLPVPCLHRHQGTGAAAGAARAVLSNATCRCSARRRCRRWSSSACRGSSKSTWCRRPTSTACFLDIYGLGVLLIGESGVGKSECALDLITRGHSLVADDRVTVKRFPSDDLVGFCDEPLRHHMELRGLGIINVQDLFGLAAVRERKAIDLVVELEHWREGYPYERLGLDETLYEILDVDVPYIKMPVALGRNLSILVEIAARNHLLKLQGHHSAREFTRKLQEQMERDRTRRQQRVGGPAERAAVRARRRRGVSDDTGTGRGWC